MTDRFTRRDLGIGIMAGLTMATIPAVAIGQPADPFSHVDPELRAAAAFIENEKAKLPPLTDQTLPAIRKVMSSFAKPPSHAVQWTKRNIPGLSGAPDVAIYIVNAKPGEARAGILHTHGGGHVFGSAAESLPDLQQLALDLDCTIVSVDYRLSPEVRYTGSTEDTYAGLKWTHRHADELGIDRRRIAVMGESAGGTHAALLAIAARDRGEVPVAFQLLVYPMLDDRTGSSRSVPSDIGTLLWTPDWNRYGWRSLLGVEPGTDAVRPSAVPARQSNLKGLPPTWIGVGAIDLFVLEDIDYARRLIEAAVPTDLLVVPGAFHAFDGLAPDAAVSKRFLAAKLSALRRGLATVA